MRRFSIALVVIVGCGGAPAAPPQAPLPAPPTPTPEVAPRPSPPAARDAQYPASRREPVTDRIHGVDVPDPYRWLEDARTPEVQAWMTAEDGYARARLAKLPGRDALATRLRELFYYESTGRPFVRGGRLFYVRKDEGRDKSIVYWRQGESGAEKVLLDPNTWSSD